MQVSSDSPFAIFLGRRFISTLAAKCDVPLSTENGSQVVNQLCAASRQVAALSREHLNLLG
jgi:hypothetical protein